ncbi:MAG: RsmG family class I SAM-dependent methyltransferase [Ilumatobacteraceae bacterium]
MTDDAALLAALAAIQERGAIGESSLERAIEHADHFVTNLPPDTGSIADLGSGGGLPGLVIAVRRPDVRLVLVERRATRADLLHRAVAALELTDRVEVFADDVALLAKRSPAAFDAVTARSFAAPPITIRWAGALLRVGGVLVVAEPPNDDPSRWPVDVLRRHGLVDQGRHQAVRVFRRC